MNTPTLLHSLFRYKAWANEELFTVVAQLNAETYASERHNALRVLNHIYVVDRIFAAHLCGQSHGYEGTNTPETPTLEALQSAVAESDRWYLGLVARLTPADLDERIAFTFTDGQKGCMSREEMLAHVATHGGYHRGAVGRILAQASLTPPRDSLSVYLHQAEPERRLSA